MIYLMLLLKSQQTQKQASEEFEVLVHLSIRLLTETAVDHSLDSILLLVRECR